MTESEATAALAEWEHFGASMRAVELSADVERAAGVPAVAPATLA